MWLWGPLSVCDLCSPRETPSLDSYLLCPGARHLQEEYVNPNPRSPDLRNFLRHGLGPMWSNVFPQEFCVLTIESRPRLYACILG